MALGSTRKFDTGVSDPTQWSAIVSMASKWVTVIDPQVDPDTGDSTVGGGPNSADNSGNPVTNADTHITNSTRHIIEREGRGGTFLALRLAYDDGLTITTDPVFEVFGRYNSDEEWGKLYNNASTPASAVTIAGDEANDAEDGTYHYTRVDPKSHLFDCLGCNQFLVGVKTALAGTGTVNNSFLQARII